MSKYNKSKPVQSFLLSQDNVLFKGLTGCKEELLLPFFNNSVLQSPWKRSHPASKADSKTSCCLKQEED